MHPGACMTHYNNTPSECRRTGSETRSRSCPPPAAGLSPAPPGSQKKGTPPHALRAPCHQGVYPEHMRGVIFCFHHPRLRQQRGQREHLQVHRLRVSASEYTVSHFRTAYRSAASAATGSLCFVARCRSSSTRHWLAHRSPMAIRRRDSIKRQRSVR